MLGVIGGTRVRSAFIRSASQVNAEESTLTRPLENHSLCANCSESSQFAWEELPRGEFDHALPMRRENDGFHGPHDWRDVGQHRWTQRR